MNLLEEFNLESRRLSTLFLGFAAAAIAFGVHEVGSWGYSISSLLGAAAGVAWAGSFICGVEWVHCQQMGMIANHFLVTPGVSPERLATLNARAKSASIKMSRYYRGQLYLLLVGAAFFAFGQGMRTFTDNIRTVDAECLAIQKDMLSANPRKSQGPALFQALGCHPQKANASTRLEREK